MCLNSPDSAQFWSSFSPVLDRYQSSSRPDSVQFFVQCSSGFVLINHWSSFCPLLVQSFCVVLVQLQSSTSPAFIFVLLQLWSSLFSSLKPLLFQYISPGLVQYQCNYYPALVQFLSSYCPVIVLVYVKKITPKEQLRNSYWKITQG